MHLSVRIFKLYWGSRITDLPGILMDRLRKGHQVAVRWSKSGKPKLLSFSDVESVGLVAVSFSPGQAGKYNQGVGGGLEDIAVRWEDLVDSERGEFQMDEGELAGKFEQLIDPNLEAKLERKQPPEHGWWPAVHVQWKGQPADFERDRAGYFQDIASGDAPIWAPCGYQIWDGSNVVDAWPIRITRPSRL